MSQHDGRQWLLLLLSSATDVGSDDLDPLDPVRIQKGMFLLSMRGPDPGVYDFVPYNWGPFSRAIYADLDALVREGLVERLPVPGRAWSLFRATRSGDEAAAAFGREIGEAPVRWVRHLRAYLSDRSFVELLRDVYAAFPEYAVSSQLDS